MGKLSGSDARYHSTYQYDSGSYENDEDKSSDEDDEWDENRRSCHCNDDFCLSRVSGIEWHPGLYEDDESDDDNNDRVCLCDPTHINAGTCCCNYLGLECDGQCHPNGYDRWLEARQVTL